MNKILRKLKYYLQWIADRKGYFMAKVFGVRVPVFPLGLLPNGFEIKWAGKTGVAIIENFCTREEADYLIARSGKRLTDSQITVGNKRITDAYRTSQTAVVFDPYNKDPAVLRIVTRAAMLLGLPANHVESVYVTRYREGEYYKAHQDAYEGFDGDRLYTTLIYLNDMADDEGGGTVFEKLNIGVRPRCGRAVMWANTNPDGTRHPEVLHEALPVAPGATKWAIQLWFRNYKMIDTPRTSCDTPQTERGSPLTGEEILPAGAWAPGDVEPDSDYGKGFS